VLEGGENMTYKYVYTVEIKGKGVIPFEFATKAEAFAFGSASFTPYKVSKIVVKVAEPAPAV